MPQLRLDDKDIHEKIGNNPQAISLLGRVRDFYKDRLSFWQKDSADGAVGQANFTFDSSTPGHLELAVADVSIRTTDRRAPLSIIHELLHLELRTEGFPLPNQDDKGKLEFAEDSFAPFASVFNTVDHHVFRERFVEIGFPVADIVREPKPSRDGMLKNWTDELIRCDDSENKWRAMYAYFQCWMTDKLRETSCEVAAFHDAMQADLSDPFDAIRAALPNIEQGMSWLPGWFNRREFATPSRYKQSIHEAAKKMHIPRWPLYRLSPSIRATLC